MKTSLDFSMKIFVLFCLTKTICGLKEDNEISGESLEKSLAQMFNAYKAASLQTSEQDQEELKKSFIQKYFHSHTPETENMYHDGPGGHPHDDDGHTHQQHQQYYEGDYQNYHQQHHHSQGTKNMYHDGPGGHPHDDDGHTHHQQHHQQNNRHLDDGHNHGKSNQGTNQQRPLVQEEKQLPNNVENKNEAQIQSNQEKQEEERVKSEKKALRDLTLTISKLLFHLSQTTIDA